MTSKDLKIIADTLLELKQRWPEGSSCAKKPNMVSFLNFRLRQQVSDFTRECLIIQLLYKPEALEDLCK